MIGLLNWLLNKSNIDFRLFVQNCIYELSDIILKNNGYLQIVDRGEMLYNNEEIKKHYIIPHKNQASVTNLKVVEDIKFLEYKPLDNGIRMVKSSFTSHEGENTPKGVAFVSVLSKK